MTGSVRCPAKINLGLEVLGKRPDGYHELRTVFQTIALYDELKLEVSRKRSGGRVVEMVCNLPELAGSSNLAARAAEALVEEMGVQRRVRLMLEKRIPPGSGLGGGSSNAAAVLRELPRLLAKRLHPARRLALAAKLGADVPFFLVGGLAIGLGRGDEIYLLPDLPPRPVVLVHPGLHISTADAYRRLDQVRVGAQARGRRTLTTAASGHNILSFSASVQSRRWNRLKNDFEPVVFSAYPELARLREVLARAGASPALLSGSGSAMFGMFDSQAAARRAASQVRRRWPEWRIWVTRTVSRQELAHE